MRAGLFEHWQAEYDAIGLATFPVRPDKTPAVRGYLRVGRKASQRLAGSFPDAVGVGIACRPNRLTVLDVDTTDERVLTDGLDRYGPTPFVVRTGSGHFQAWYRHDGEKRSIRPEPSVPIDVLGDGFVVAPPSQTEAGTYKIIAGDLDDLPSLPKMRPAPAIGTSPPLEKGRRNVEMFGFALRVAAKVRKLEELIDMAMDHNQTAFAEALPAEEVLKVIASAWGYEVEGRNWAGRGPRIVTGFSVVDDLAAGNPRAFALYGIVQRHHAGSETFVLANAMAESIGWDSRAFKSARQTLIDRNLIVCVHAGGRGPGDPPLFRFGPYKKGYKNAPQY